MREEIKQRIEQIRRGEVPKGYKRTKAGVVPIEWEEVRIGDVLTQRKTLQCVSKDAPLLSFTIEEGVIDPADKKSNKRDFLIKDITTKKFALTEVGDIIYNPANLKFGAIHRNNLRRGVVSPIYGIFYGAQNSTFMGHLLHNQRFIDYAKIYAEGTVEKLKTLSADTFKKLKITLSSLKEQEKIAEILAAQDKLIELQQKKIDELKRLKKVYLSKMFPKKGCNVPEIRFPGFTAPWEQRKLGEVGKARSGVGFPDTEQGGTIGVPFFKVSDMNSDGNENEMTVANNYVTAEQIAAHRWSPIEELPAIFFAKVGAAVMLNRKRLCRFPFLLDNNTMAYSLSSTEWDADFAKALFETIDLTSLVQVGALPSYNAGDVEAMAISMPSLSEQGQIGEFFKQLDNLITLHQRKLDEEQKKKKSLMQLLLTGIVRVEVIQ